MGGGGGGGGVGVAVNFIVPIWKIQAAFLEYTRVATPT